MALRSLKQVRQIIDETLRASAITRIDPQFSWERYFQIGISSPPQKRNPRRPIFSVDGLAGVGVLLRRQNPSDGVEHETRDHAPNCPWSDAHLGIVPDPLVLPRVGARHDVK